MGRVFLDVLRSFEAGPAHERRGGVHGFVEQISPRGMAVVV